MLKFSLILALFSFSLGASPTDFWGPTASVNYVGFLKISGSRFKVRTKLELLRSKEADGKTQTVAFLKLKLGGFHTHEYLTQSYRIEGDPAITHELSLNGLIPGQGPDFSVAGNFSEDSSRFEAEVRTERGGLRHGQLILLRVDESFNYTSLDSLFPDSPKLPAITGTYLGRCGKRPQLLHLLHWRQSTSELPTFEMFPGYVVTGHLGGVERSVTPNYWAVEQHATAGSFDFYQEEIKLGEMGLVCSLTPEGLSCNRQCEFKRDDKRTKNLGLTSEACHTPERKEELPRIEPSKAISAQTSTDKLKTEYYGYLHLEGRNAYQFMSLETVPLNGKVGFIAKFFIGLPNKLRKSTSIPFDFKPTPLSKDCSSLHIQSQFDPALHIIHWYENSIEGIWYSKTAGRIGTFKLLKGSLDHLEEAPRWVTPLRPLEGFYQQTARDGTIRQLDLFLGTTSSLGYSSYFPLRVTGEHGFLFPTETRSPVLGMDVPMTFTETIVQDHVDPFSGLMVLKLSSTRMLLGRFAKEGIEILDTPANDYGVQMLPFKWSTYLPVKTSFRDKYLILDR